MPYGNGKYSYELVEGWAKLPDEEAILDACGVAIDSRDRVFVFTRGTHHIMIYDSEGNFLDSWGTDLFTKVHGGCIGPDNSIYFADADGHRIYKFTMDGKQLLQLGNKDHGSDTGFDLETFLKKGLVAALDTIKQSAPPFNMPTNVCLSPSGDIYVSDGYGNARIHRFSPDGNLLSSFGEPGRGPGQFRVPHAVWVDKNETIWVADRENNRIQIFDVNGKFMDQWTNFKQPCDIFIDKDEVIYVAELKRRVSILSNDGKLLSRLVCEEQDKESALLLAPHGIAVDSKGDIYVGEVAMGIAGIDRRGRAVQKFARVSRMT